MGRETKILLTILGLLAGVFMGVVSLKLFVPRPPVGTGPDVHVASEPLPLVDPPSLDSPPIDPPAVAPDDAYAGRSSRFGSPGRSELPPETLATVPVAYEHVVTADGAATGAATPTHDLPDLVPPAAIEAIDPEPPAASERSFAEPPAPPPADERYDQRPLLPVTAPPAVTRSGPAPGDTYVTRAGDSWWSLAEHAYGDGRLYRALYAWNRSLDNRVSLVPGTRLDIPPVVKLGAAWSTLLPTD